MVKNRGNLTDEDLARLVRLRDLSLNNSTILALLQNYSIPHDEMTTDESFNNLPIIRIIFYVMYIMIFIIGVFGNTLVCWVVLRNKTMQTVTNLFITNLALSDILLCIFAVPFTPLYLLTYKSWVSEHWAYIILLPSLPLHSEFEPFTGFLKFFRLQRNFHGALFNHLSRRERISILWNSRYSQYATGISMLHLHYFMHVYFLLWRWWCQGEEERRGKLDFPQDFLLHARDDHNFSSKAYYLQAYKPWWMHTSSIFFFSSWFYDVICIFLSDIVFDLFRGSLYRIYIDHDCDASEWLKCSSNPPVMIIIISYICFCQDLKIMSLRSLCRGWLCSFYGSGSSSW